MVLDLLFFIHIQHVHDIEQQYTEHVYNIIHQVHHFHQNIHINLQLTKQQHIHTKLKTCTKLTMYIS